MIGNQLFKNGRNGKGTNGKDKRTGKISGALKSVGKAVGFGVGAALLVVGVGSCGDKITGISSLYDNAPYSDSYNSDTPDTNNDYLVSGDSQQSEMKSDTSSSLCETELDDNKNFYLFTLPGGALEVVKIEDEVEVNGNTYIVKSYKDGKLNLESDDSSLEFPAEEYGDNSNFKRKVVVTLSSSNNEVNTGIVLESGIKDKEGDKISGNDGSSVRFLKYVNESALLKVIYLSEEKELVKETVKMKEGDTSYFAGSSVKIKAISKDVYGNSDGCITQSASFTVTDPTRNGDKYTVEIEEGKEYDLGNGTTVKLKETVKSECCSYAKIDVKIDEEKSDMLLEEGKGTTINGTAIKLDSVSSETVE